MYKPCTLLALISLGSPAAQAAYSFTVPAVSFEVQTADGQPIEGLIFERSTTIRETRLLELVFSPGSPIPFPRTLTETLEELKLETDATGKAQFDRKRFLRAITPARTHEDAKVYYGPRALRGACADLPIHVDVKIAGTLNGFCATEGSQANGFSEVTPTMRCALSVRSSDLPYLRARNARQCQRVQADLDLHDAISDLDIAKFRDALERGADVNAWESRDGGVYRRDDIALDRAVSYGFTDGIDLLLNGTYGLQDEHSLSVALLSASAGGNRALAERLLSLGADVNKRSSRLWTPLMWVIHQMAEGTGHYDTFELLIGRTGIDLSPRDEDGRTPLAWARELSQSPYRSDAAKALLRRAIDRLVQLGAS
jgi:hypothetical protein